MLALVAVLEINRALLHHGDLSIEELPVVPSIFNSLVLGGERPDRYGLLSSITTTHSTI